MGVRKADVQKERLLRLGLLGDVIHGGFGNVALYLATVIRGVGPDLGQFSGRIGFPDAGLNRGDGCVWHPGARHQAAIQGAAGRLNHADVVLVEALARRPTHLARPEMPLANNAGVVTLALEQFAQGHFAGLQGVRRATENDRAQTGAL